MSNYLIAAATLAIVIGLVHSFLGERWVFSRLRKGTWIPTQGGTLLRGPHMRILWATWHMVTVLVGTRGRHPGWIGLMGDSSLSWSP